jgi:hypothetical protein
MTYSNFDMGMLWSKAMVVSVAEKSGHDDLRGTVAMAIPQRL